MIPNSSLNYNSHCTSLGHLLEHFSAVINRFWSWLKSNWLANLIWFQMVKEYYDWVPSLAVKIGKSQWRWQGPQQDKHRDNICWPMRFEWKVISLVKQQNQHHHQRKIILNKCGDYNRNRNHRRLRLVFGRVVECLLLKTLVSRTNHEKEAMQFRRTRRARQVLVFKIWLLKSVAFGRVKQKTKNADETLPGRKTEPKEWWKWFFWYCFPSLKPTNY